MRILETQRAERAPSTVTRGAALGAIAAVMCAGVAKASTSSEKAAFIAQCDESISISRLAGAPYKFVGKKVDLHGIVGPPIDEHTLNLNDPNDPEIFVAVIGNAKTLEEGQALRVLGIVLQPVQSENTSGGGRTYAVVQSRYME